MDRNDAEQVFRLVADLRGDLGDRWVADRWWLVWSLMGFEIAATNAVTQILLEFGNVRLWVHLSVWAVQVLALAATIRIAHHRKGGNRLQRERFIWWIWCTFLSAAGLLVVLNGLLGLQLFRTASALPLLAAFAFSMMGMAVEFRFTAVAAVFALCAVAMAVFPRFQFFVYGTTWLAVLEVLGLIHRPRKPMTGRAL